MKLIKPNQISGEILTLFAEADEKVIIVSPYCNFKTWNKLKNALDVCKRKGIDVEFYVRHDQPKSLEQVKEIGFEPISIRNLHTKLYINESYAIITSMNLIEFSDQNSLDIAYMTQNKREYKEVLEYYTRYILQNQVTLPKFMDEDSFMDWRNDLEEKISNTCESRFKIHCNDDEFIIQGPNRYNVHIRNNSKGNYLNLCGILSAKQAKKANSKPVSIPQSSKMEFKLYEPNSTSEYNTIWHHSTCKLQSESITKITKKEAIKVEKDIILFVSSIEKFKSSFRPNWT